MFDYRSMFDLSGKTALVVGAGSGIGEASAQGLAVFGAHVVCADVNAEAAEDTASEITSEGGETDAIELDLTDPDSVRRAVESVGVPDVLVSTPSINVRKPVLEITDDEFDQIVELNLKGTFRLIRDFGRGMAERGSGSIIAFSSIRGQVVEPGQGIYAATKAGTVQMLRAAGAGVETYRELVAHAIPDGAELAPQARAVDIERLERHGKRAEQFDKIVEVAQEMQRIPLRVRISRPHSGGAHPHRRGCERRGMDFSGVSSRFRDCRTRSASCYSSGHSQL